MPPFYDQDLADIHHAAFTDLARNAGETVLHKLHQYGIDTGLVVDLGCGSGVWAGMLTAAGFDVLGYDISCAMLRLAKQNAPNAELRRASLYDAPIPSCTCVTAFGEALNYKVSDAPPETLLRDLFCRISSSHATGGMFVFDVLVQPDGPPMRYRSWNAGADWAVLVDVSENPAPSILNRHMTLFRDPGSGYRRSEELHVVSVMQSQLVESCLVDAGFDFTVSRTYGAYELPDRRTAYFARKGS